MKTKFAKSMVMVAMALSLSSQAYAQDDINESMKMQKKSEVKEVAVNKVSAEVPTNSIDSESDRAAERQQEASQVSRLDDLTAKASEGNLELQILQQKLERKKIESQLKEDDFQKRLEAAMSSLSSQFQEKEAEYRQTIESLQNELRRQRHINAQEKINAEEAIKESKKTENNVFVTNVVGVGNNLTASIYYEDKIIDVREGMKIDAELKVLQILPNGVVFEDKGEDSFVALTNEEYAFSKTFNKGAAKLMEATMSGQRRNFN